jgi:hypothetical protein
MGLPVGAAVDLTLTTECQRLVDGWDRQRKRAPKRPLGVRYAFAD